MDRFSPSVPSTATLNATGDMDLTDKLLKSPIEGEFSKLHRLTHPDYQRFRSQSPSLACDASRFKHSRRSTALSPRHPFYSWEVIAGSATCSVKFFLSPRAIQIHTKSKATNSVIPLRAESTQPAHAVSVLISTKRRLSEGRNVQVRREPARVNQTYLFCV